MKATDQLVDELATAIRGEMKSFIDDNYTDTSIVNQHMHTILTKCVQDLIQKVDVQQLTEIFVQKYIEATKNAPVPRLETRKWK